jgi:asparagine N-glycosylation enzyme membrane subunit Stt3
MLSSIPLLIVPFILYNMGLAGFFGGGPEGDPWATEIFSFTMMSGGVFSMTLGISLIVLALLLLFVEIVKSTRTSNASVVDHLLSTFVFVAFLVEFLLVKGAAHPVFFTLMVITLVDVLAGFSVSLRASGRDVHLG